jgi:hypothetical protein
MMVGQIGRCWFDILLYQLSTMIFTLLPQIDPGSDLRSFQQKPSKTIGPPRKPEGNAAHRVYCAVSPEIALWVAEILKCLQPGNEWRSVVILGDPYLFSLTSD